jgi:hypothetical protein
MPQNSLNRCLAHHGSDDFHLPATVIATFGVDGEDAT